MSYPKNECAPGSVEDRGGAKSNSKRPEAYRGIGFQCDIPFDQWPSVESAAFAVIVGDRERSGARKLLRRFLTRGGLKQALAQCPGRWLLVFLMTPGQPPVVTSVNTLQELIQSHRAILGMSKVVRGHVEVFHGLDAQTRAAIIEDGKAVALATAPVGGNA